MSDELWVRWVYGGDGRPAGEPFVLRGSPKAAAGIQSDKSAYLEVLNTGERFYPAPPKPAPERIGAVAKRVRLLLESNPGLASDLGTVMVSSVERLLACAEASDAYDGSRSRARLMRLAWRRTVTGDSAND